MQKLFWDGIMGIVKELGKCFSLGAAVLIGFLVPIYGILWMLENHPTGLVAIIGTLLTTLLGLSLRAGGPPTGGR
jgi:hypothetical protein